MQQNNQISERGGSAISFSDVIHAINRLKYFLLGIVFLSIAISGVLIGFHPGVDDPVTFFVELVSIKNKAYPNGSTFSANDLLSADVLENIKNKYKIYDWRSQGSNATRAENASFGVL